MARVVITDAGGLDFTPGIAALQAAGHDVRLLDEGIGDIKAEIADADALIVSFRPIDADVISAARRLRVIATTTTGLDQIDQDAAASADVAVRPLPSPASEEVATHALAGALSLLRELPAGRAASIDWDYTRIPTPPRVSELTLGVYGLGRIARKLVERALPLFQRIVAYDPFVPVDAWPAEVERVETLDDLFRRSQVLSLHAPATAENHHAVNGRTIGLMPPGAYLVNVARGELVDTDAVIAAVDSGHLRGAFLDVLDPEPPAADDPVLHHERIIVTPHAAFSSTATELAYVMVAVENVLRALAENIPARGAENE